MTAASETGRAELTASVVGLAQEVARLAHNVEYVVATAKMHRQEGTSHNRCASKSKPRKAECTPGVNEESATGVVEEAAICPLSQVDEPALAQSKEKVAAESLVAAGISDLYDRLGGFLKTSLQPPHEDARSKFE
jgi:hypothetical protein